MPAKGLLFDFDGTLYGDWRLWISLIQETLLDKGISITGNRVLEKTRSMIKDGRFVNISGVAIAIAREHGLNKDLDVRNHFLERMDRVMDETGPGEDLVKLLDNLAKDKISMGLVTFMRRPRLMRRLELWKLNNYFRTIVTPEHVEEFKPSPQPFAKAMTELGVAPGQCFVVGDEPVDMIGGKKAGAKTVGLPQGFYSGEELRAAGADFILSSLTLLPTVIQY